MQEPKESKDTSKKNGNTDEPVLTLRQWLLIIATLIAAAIAAYFLK